MILSTEPTAIARWILWILSNSLATSPSFCERTVADISMRRARIIAVCRPSADDGGERPLHGGGLHAFVQPLRKDHEGAPVVPGDHHEHNGTPEVGDRPADLRSIFELPAAHG